MPSNKLARISSPPDFPSTEQVIREWLVRLAEIHRKNGAPYPLTPVMTAVWIESLRGIDADVLDAAFRKVMEIGCRREFPIPADVRGHVDSTRETAIAAAADVEWQNLLEYVREWIHPDIQKALSARAPKLSEPVDRAARAAGGLNYLQNCSHENLQWAKKRFVESYLAWDTLEQDQFLLPDGELKSLLTGAAQAKALPPSPHSFDDLHAHGLEYAKTVRSAMLPQGLAPETRQWKSAEEREEAYRALNEKETNPVVIENARRQKAASEAKGFSTR